MSYAIACPVSVAPTLKTTKTKQNKQKILAVRPENRLFESESNSINAQRAKTDLGDSTILDTFGSVLALPKSAI